MTETTAGALNQVTELDEERRRYEGWIAQLDARRDATPAHVFERVHADYTERLHAVVARLAEHAGLLRDAVTELASRVDELRAEEQRCADERAEAELRAAVGEYGADQWREIEARTDATLADLVAERQQVEAELARLEQVLALADPAAPLPGTSGDAAPAAAAEAVSEEPSEPSSEPVFVQPDGTEPVASTTPAGVPAVASAEDEGDILPIESLAPTDAVWPAPPPDVAPAAPAASPPPEPQRWASSDNADGWAAGLGATNSAEHGGLGIPPLGGTMEDGGRTENASLIGEGSNTPIKTLKCQECGTMNYPTEWYCERCGGELAAL